MPSCTPTTLSHSFQSHPPYLLPSYYIPYHLIPSHSTLSSIISHDMILHHPIPRRLTRSEPSSHHIRPPHSTPPHHPSLSAYSIPFHVISHPLLYPTSCHPKLPTPYHPICSRTTPPYHYLYPIRCYLTQLYTTTPYSTPSCLISAHFTSQHTSPLHPIMPPHPIHSHFMSSNTNHYIPPISSNIPPPPSPRPIPFNRLLPHSIPFLHFQSHSIPYHISNSLHHVLFHVTALRLIPHPNVCRSTFPTTSHLIRSRIIPTHPHLPNPIRCHPTSSTSSQLIPTCPIPFCAISHSHLLPIPSNLLSSQPILSSFTPNHHMSSRSALHYLVALYQTHARRGIQMTLAMLYGQHMPFYVFYSSLGGQMRL